MILCPGFVKCLLPSGRNRGGFRNTSIFQKIALNAACWILRNVTWFYAAFSPCWSFHVAVSPTDSVAQLIPDADSPLHDRVQQYRQLLDGLPMDAYTHGCILHPELTTDSMIPKYATAEIRSK